MRLETERLVLRRIAPGDAPFLLELLNEPAFLRQIGDKGVRDETDARRYVLEGPVASYERFGFGLYLVALKASAEPIGICGLLKRESLGDADVGFAFLQRFWSHGYASEAAAAVLAEARRAFGLARIVAIVAPGNAASVRVLEKLGFRHEGRRRLSEQAPWVELYASEPRPDQP